MKKINKDDNRAITLQVRRVNGHWETLLGGDPPVFEGTVAELKLRAGDLCDDAFKRLLDQQLLVRVLEEGAELMVALAGVPAEHDALRDRRPPLIPAWYWPGDLRFVPVRIGPPGVASRRIDPERGGLWLRHSGLDMCEMVSSTILLPPGPGRVDAISPNHAYTVLSERYETHRLSHTGNVYERVFFQESDGQWYPLSGLRDGVRERAERRVLASAWQAIEAQLGWCRLPPHPDTLKSRKPKNAP